MKCLYYLSLTDINLFEGGFEILSRGYFCETLLQVFATELQKANSLNNLLFLCVEKSKEFESPSNIL